MKRFKIVSENGIVMGVFQAKTPAEALDAMAMEAGYYGQTDAEEVTKSTFKGAITEVTD